MADKGGPDVNFAYMFLYGVEPEVPVDPNSEANREYIRRLKEKQGQEFLRFITGSGKSLYRKWGKKLKTMNLALLADRKTTMDGDKNCTCNACMLIREMRQLLELCAEAEAHLRISKREP